MNIVTIIQARMGSTRLPGKVLQDVAGVPMLRRVVERSMRATTTNETLVATTTCTMDDAIVALCRAHGWTVFRGSESDVLGRFYSAAFERRADVVVRVTSDCPLIDPGVIDRVVGEFLKLGPAVHYASNVIPRRTFPVGLDTEVMTFDALERASREDSCAHWREHVTPYIYRNPALFQLHCVVNDADHSGFRWTVDTPEDLEFVRAVYSCFPADDNFTWHDVLLLLERRPQLADINRHVVAKRLATG